MQAVKNSLETRVTVLETHYEHVDTELKNMNNTLTSIQNTLVSIKEKFSFHSGASSARKYILTLIFSFCGAVGALELHKYLGVIVSYMHKLIGS